MCPRVACSSTAWAPEQPGRGSIPTNTDQHKRTVRASLASGRIAGRPIPVHPFTRCVTGFYGGGMGALALAVVKERLQCLGNTTLIRH